MTLSWYTVAMLIDKLVKLFERFGPLLLTVPFLIIGLIYLLLLAIFYV